MSKLIDINNLDKLSKALDAHYKELIDKEKARALAEEQKLQDKINATEDMLGGKSIRYVTQAEYDGLTEEEKNNSEITYFIVDAIDSSHGHENKDFLDNLAARNIAIGNKSQIFDGVNDLVYSIEDIGAAPAEHSHSYLPLTGGLVTGNVQIDGNLVNNNNATFNKQVTFNDVATIGAGANLSGSEVQINADVLVNNSPSTHNQVATFNEDVSFNKNVTFGEDAVLSGNKVQIDANTLVNNAVSTHNQAATFNGDATFNSPTTLGAGANLAGDKVQIDANTLVNNAVSTHNKAATFNGETTFNSPTTLGAGANLAGDEVQINASTLVNNAVSTHNQAATFNNTVLFNEQATFSKDLNVAGNVSITAETGDAWFNGNIFVGADNKKLATEEFVTNSVEELRKEMVILEEDDLTMDGLIDNTFPSLTTEDKTLLGAINELNNKSTEEIDKAVIDEILLDVFNITIE